MKKEEKEKAIYLRKVEGLSIKQIAVSLGVAKSSVSGWVKDVELTKKQLQKLDTQNPAKRQFVGKRVGGEFVKRKAAEKRVAFQEQGRNDCSDFNLHLAGCMLYWAEGAKNRNGVQFANTDKFMMVLFKKFLNKLFGVSDENILITCRSHVLSPYTLSEVESYWLQQLGINRANLRKGNIETRIPKVKKVKYPFGICTLLVHDTNLVQRIFGAIKQYVGVDDVNLWL